MISSPLSVVHFSTSDSHGAHRATYLLHRALLSSGVQSEMLVKFKTNTDPSVSIVGKPTFPERLRSSLDPKSALGSFYLETRRSLRIRLGKPMHSFNENTNTLILRDALPHLSKVDIILLSWIDGFLSTGMIRRLYEQTRAPIIWTLMDAEPVTGGCHYPGTCRGYTRRCGLCPQLPLRKEQDLSRKNWLAKYADLSDLPITFVAPSRWLRKKVKSSSLFRARRVEHILLSVDTRLFRTASKEVARRSLQLPSDKHVVFFGARSMAEERKGMRYFVEALQILKERLRKTRSFRPQSVLWLSAGERLPDVDFGFPLKHFGFVYDMRTLARLYQASDVFACSSIEDGGPMMINEAIMCATPTVAFDTGVAPDLITSGERGYVAKIRDAKDFAQGLYRSLTLTSRGSPSFTEKRCFPFYQARSYRKLFSEVIISHSKGHPNEKHA